MSTIQKEIKGNTLFPVFLKLDELHLLIAGGGTIACEKLRAVINNSPSARVRLVARHVSNELRIVALASGNVELIERDFLEEDLSEIDLVITALNDVGESERIREVVKKRKLLVNTADKPDLCDFYLGSIVRKGDLKIAISTNGKSPTMAKRIKETLNDVFPEETQEVLENLYKIREDLRGDFEHKVKTLNAITKEMVNDGKKLTGADIKIKKSLVYSIIVVMLMVIGHLLISYIPAQSMKDLYFVIKDSLDKNFGLYVIGGFIAQMIDGSLGMAYGVSVTTFLMSLGLPAITPAVASASMHASEVFTTGSSSLVYMRFRNINMKLFRKLLIPGIIGTMLGVLTVCFVSKESFLILKPFVAVYTLILGVIIIARALKIDLRNRNKIRKIFPVAFFGGFLDSVGGGGWGPIVTTSLVAGGRNLKYSVGSSHLAKFFVALFSSLAFFSILGISHWQIIFGLVIGGMLAAPVSIYLSNRISVKKGLIFVGAIVIIISLKNIIQSLI